MPELDENTPIYRAYLLNEDGSIAMAEVLTANTDDEAIRLARQLVDGHAIEVWDRARKVTLLPSVD